MAMLARRLCARSGSSYFAPVRSTPLAFRTQRSSFCSVEASVATKLKDALSASQCVVEDRSGGCGQSFSIVIESEQFRGLTKLKCQRMVQEVIREEIAQWHAVSIQTKAITQAFVVTSFNRRDALQAAGFAAATLGSQAVWADAQGEPVACLTRYGPQILQLKGAVEKGDMEAVLKKEPKFKLLNSYWRRSPGWLPFTDMEVEASKKVMSWREGRRQREDRSYWFGRLKPLPGGASTRDEESKLLEISKFQHHAPLVAMVLGLLAQNCFPLVFLLQRAREEAWKAARSTRRRQRPVEELLRRLAYPHAVDEKSEHSELLHIVWTLIQSFLGDPPELQVATFEVDPFTFNHTVKLWDSREMRTSKFLVGHTDTVLTVAMKGNIVVTGSYDCTAKAWDASRGVLLKTILNDCSVTAVGVEHSTIIIGGVNGVAALGKLTGDQAVLDFSTTSNSPDCVHLLGHSNGISTVLLHGSVAVTGSRDRSCRIWHSTGGVKRVLSHPCCSAPGEQLATVA
eukprot:symbB.v1.2.016393.t1/scaffold1247.1/size129121/1